MISADEMEQIRENAEEDMGRTDRRVLLAEVDRLTDAVVEVEAWLATERKASRDLAMRLSVWEARGRRAELEQQWDVSLARAEKAEAALARVQTLAERWSASPGDKAKWASAQVLEAAIREPKPKPWDNCTNPEPMDGIHYGYCRNCRGMLIANDVEETDNPNSRLVMVHPPTGWKP